MENDETADFLVSATDEVKIRVFDGSKILSEFTLDRSSKSRDLRKGRNRQEYQVYRLGSGKWGLKFARVVFGIVAVPVLWMWCDAHRFVCVCVSL